ncbi:MAG: ABC transporter ATP-binding protein [Desulfatiglandales bacterium]|jgi:oligopeptide/dipeptide ABC transporter ATP-binding protein|nr:ABC transporter ATP-binding protein [Desulfatiglandales bacterium]MDP7353461.1 ABC transporter ATP-binding protein [Desulfobacterales bacterium]|tara:strand:- start:433 stop:1416 length:984 start_codon:yes stop_codon:yes gene_type:complete
MSKIMDLQGIKSSVIEIKDLKTWFPIQRGILSKTAGYVRAVDGISLAIGRGEIVGLVGESGCGKSTLGRTIVGLEKAWKGTVFFHGQNLFTLNRRDRRQVTRKLQIIFQDPLSSLNPRMNVFDIVTEGLVEFGMIEGNRDDHAKRLLNEAGLEGDVIFRYPHEFSGGQRQRINIARAISMRPDFIVCDEPVSALDVSVQAQVINLLIDLRDTHNLSYLFISHDLSVVSSIANRVAVMYLGILAEYGSTVDVIDHPMHPYTIALISAVPVPGRDKKKRIVLEGETPSPSAPPPGCRFHTRCPEVMKVCRVKVPSMTRLGTRQVWCHLY